MSEFDKKYQSLAHKIYTQGFTEKNERTGEIVKALPGENLEVYPQDGFPFLTLRRLRPETFAAELVWCLTGSRRPDDLLTKFAKIWDGFKGLTGVVSTAYGYRWMHHFGRDQLDLLVKLLEKDPSSRHGLVVTWDPREDGLGGVKKPNIPCPFGFSVNIMGDQTHLHNFVRSNDWWLGAPTDIAGFALLQHIVAARLGRKVGKYTHSISNVHFYENQFNGVETLLARQDIHPPIKLESNPDWYERGRAGDEFLIKEIATQIRDQYKPQPAIGGITVVK